MQPPRIRPLESPYPPEVVADFEAIMPAGMEPLRIFRTLAHSPRVLRRIRLGGLLDRGPVDGRDRELVILRTCARRGSEYEWGVHVVAFARRFGLSEEAIRATVHASADDPVWSEDERRLVRLVDELCDTADVSDGLWEELSAHYSEAQIVELLVLCGFYHAIAFVTNALRIEREEASEPWPAAVGGGAGASVS